MPTKVNVHTDVYARLERIKELWRELERTRPASSRYDVLVEMIRTESSAYLAILQTQPDRDRVQADHDRAQPARDRADDPARPPKPTAVASPNRVYGRLERIKELWLELEGTNRTSARYEALVEMIRAESSAVDFAGQHDFTDRRTSRPGKASGDESRLGRRQE